MEVCVYGSKLTLAKRLTKTEREREKAFDFYFCCIFVGLYMFVFFSLVCRCESFFIELFLKRQSNFRLLSQHPLGSRYNHSMLLLLLFFSFFLSNSIAVCCFCIFICRLPLLFSVPLALTPQSSRFNV